MLLLKEFNRFSVDIDTLMKEEKSYKMEDQFDTDNSILDIIVNVTEFKQ